ncbi:MULTISPECIES: enoyl-CoA hydratase-related protein [Auritidibacter]|uniref:enoyl-CoA hydratase-related protein n=1 Tax=Auritidibacter TaxID=1160973 RepID=UPI000D7307FB|nr:MULTISPECIES: enoyl-CoA hydratase-related protein [Auritidibacter]AXR73406.1 enoyl-CoA hydratase [Auritidibacter sp. NML130574]NIH70800.1 enoyl-CoA hydratase [Auritidibacter ignavus]RMX22350.1 enoyl-CoA hydratase [Auritidibacter ignavus]
MTSVVYTLEGSTATLTLDAPENRNAINQALLQGISEGLDRASADDSVRSIVLTHTGSVFCAGADLKDHSLNDTEGGTPTTGASTANAVIRELLTCPKPIIAAVHGHVRAGGMGFVAACDFVVAGPQSTFGLTEVRIGVVAAMIAPVVLARLGDRTAAGWLLRARTITPDEALSAGFISHAITDTDGSVDGTVEEILTDLRKAAPAALEASKMLVNRHVLELMDTREQDMVELSQRFFAGDDAKAGMTAFLNKQHPPWVLDA